MRPEREFATGSFRFVRQLRHELQAFAKKLDRFRIGRKLHGAFSGFLPIGDRLLRIMGSGVVMRQQLRLVFDGVAKPFFEDLGDARV